jgi:hypothetical protein
MWRIGLIARFDHAQGNSAAETRTRFAAKMMKTKRLIASLAAIAAVISANGAVTAINVFQGGASLGAVQPYTGAMSGANNFNYFSASGHPISGPAPARSAGKLFFYDGTDGLSFAMVFGKDADQPSSSDVDWNLAVTGTLSGNPGVSFSDDANELKEPSNGNFTGLWNFASNTDGGVIGGLDGAAWVLTIDPLYYDKIDTLEVYDKSGSSIALNLAVDATGDMMFMAVPEPSAAFAVLGMSALGAVAALRRFKARSS